MHLGAIKIPFYQISIRKPFRDFPRYHYVNINWDEHYRPGIPNVLGFHYFDSRHIHLLILVLLFLAAQKKRA